MKAVVLAAGLGTRLHPLTEILPKALFPVLNIPLLELVLRNLARFGVNDVGVNLHHMREGVISFLRERRDSLPKVHTALEEEIVGTAGGIAHFADLVGNEEFFLVHNCDVLSDIDLTPAIAFHRERAPLCTLVVVDHPATNNVLLGPDGRILDIRQKLGIPAPPGSRKVTYSGISIFSPRIYCHLEPGVYACLVDTFLFLLSSGEEMVLGYAPGDAYWRDLGSISSYLALHRDILCERRFSPAGWIDSGSSVIIDPQAVVAPDAKLHGFVCVGKDCFLEQGVTLRDCLVWEGTRLRAGFASEFSIIAGNLVMKG